MTNTTITKIIEMENEIRFQFHRLSVRLDKDSLENKEIVEIQGKIVEDYIKETLLVLSRLAIERLEGKLFKNPDPYMTLNLGYNQALNQEIEHHKQIIAYLTNPQSHD